MNETFHFRINGGPERTLEIATGRYSVAVAAALGWVSDADAEKSEISVEIWHQDVVPEYGPYQYVALWNRFGNLEIRSVRPEPADIPL